MAAIDRIITLKMNRRLPRNNGVNLSIKFYSLMTCVCSASEYCTITHFDARFDSKLILVNML